MGFAPIVLSDNFSKPETRALWWNRVITNASKVGKGLSVDTKAHKLFSKYWIESIDPMHRYGNNLQLYCKKWLQSSTTQHFFFWLDFGDGKDVDLEECPRSMLNQQCVKYFGPVIDEEKKKRNAEEMGDAMKSLENRTLDTKREMDILAALDEMKSMKSRHTTVSVDAMLEALQQSNETKERKLEEEDEALIKAVFKGPREPTVIRRIDDDDDLPMFSFDKEGTSADHLKRRKLSEEPCNPTDSLTTATDLDSSNGFRGF